MTVALPEAFFFEQLSQAARECLVRCRDALAVDNKSDNGFDPVTNADRAVEHTVRAIIERHFPEHAITGEELPGRYMGNDVRWSIDPIDGTRAFICGLPSWSILVGLVQGGQHVAGMIDLPATAELFIAVDGETLLNGAPVRTSGQKELAEARFSTTDPFLFEDAEFEAFDRVRRSVLLTRYGLDGSAYARVAAGDLDLVIESGLKPHDYDALIPIVRFAGGHIGDWSGGEDFSSGRIIATASRELYEAAVEIMRDTTPSS